MPIEIRELIIKATVNNKNSGSSGSGDGGSSGSSEAVINEVVNRVFEILKEKSER
ncbi:DUF5908 family protein [Mariniflexile gromovii]|uniref:Uncharacterized protein n=1 Tax=Mariniflexile gromovii TaxID=362523 RepID=A0ABS4BUB8_9FLAO|nr:DUF5908 family protein [Mariniflexile gromovii]MBP0904190.1 hypothetical protein [Mariniflexile gromovii]